MRRGPLCGARPLFEQQLRTGRAETIFQELSFNSGQCAIATAQPGG
jgi:hypothetical protein